MVNILDRTIQKIAELELELKNIRISSAIEIESNKVAQAALSLLLHKVSAKAELAVRVSSQSVIAANQALMCADEAENELVRLLLENAVHVAEHAVEVSSDAAASVANVLNTAKVIVSHQSDAETIKASMVATSAVIRAAEVAAEATRLAQSATHVVKVAISPPEKKAVA